MNKDLPIIIGICGATGSVYALKLIAFLLTNGYKIIVVFSENALLVTNQELNLNFINDKELLKNQLLSYLKIDSYNDNIEIHLNTDIGANIASGSFITSGMIILPCSMNTLASIKVGLANSLITRAADVCIKQGRKLVLAPREMPFSSIHLENMLALSLKGVKIAVPAPAFYGNPQDIGDMINFVVGKILDTFEVHNELYKRWK